MNNLHPLDRPVWNCLNGPQRHLAAALGEATRIDPDFGPFAAAKDTSATAQTALGEHFVGPGDTLWIVEPEPWPAPPGTEIIAQKQLVQMVADRPQAPLSTDKVALLLGDEDAAAMTALASATEPGPWGRRTHQYGNFYGFRHAGELQAMAGMRMLPGGDYAEISGVCTWPHFQGQGLAGQLIRRVMADMTAQGLTPFLHSYAANSHAVRLYESLGFRARRAMTVTIIRKTPEPV